VNPLRSRARWTLAVPAAAVVVLTASATTATAAGTTRATHINSAEQSTNWSGYGANVTETGVSTPYTSVSGRWVVPKVSAEKKGQAEDTSTWIGIGGNTLNPVMPAGDPTLIQTGTEQDIGAGGKTTYDAWWEILPEPETEITSMKVAPGDVMKATISQSSVPEDWTITIADLTKGGSDKYTTTTPYPSLMDTVEWIHEAPTLIGTDAGVATLAKSAPVRFGATAVNGKAFTLGKADQIQMTDSNGKVIAQPSKPNAKKTGFDVCVYSGTKCPAPTKPVG
jgi:hypothetical protein